MKLSKYLLLLVLMLLLAACTQTAPDVPTNDAGDETVSAEEEVDPPDPTPTENPRGSFEGEAYSTSGLPNLTLVAEADTTLCVSSQEEPAITLEPAVWDISLLCLYNFEVGEGAPPIDIILEAPDGTTYSEIYEFVESESGRVRVIGNRTQLEGQFRTGVGTDTTISLLLRFDATLPSGEWTARASNGSTDVETTVDVAFEPPLSAAVPLEYMGDPFIYQEELTYSDGDQVRLVGQGYEADSQLEVALYVLEFDSTMLPYYATRVDTDSEGRWDTVFEVGPQTLGLQYQVVVEPESVDGAVNAYGTGFAVTR